MLGFCFTVLSAKRSPLAVEERIEAFLTTWRNELVHTQSFGVFLSELQAVVPACLCASELPSLHPLQLSRWDWPFEHLCSYYVLWLHPDTFRDSLIAMKLQKDTTLRAESGRHWAVISEGRETFNREQLEAAELMKITKEDVLAYFDSKIAKGSEGRRLLMCRVYCSAHATEMEKEAELTMAAAIKDFGKAEVEHVPDVETWRASVAQRPCYPTTV